MPEMTWRDGVLLTDSGDVIACPGMSLCDLLATHTKALITVDGNEISTYRRVVIDPVMIQIYECAVAEYFTQNVLAAVDICVTQSTAKRLSFVTGYASPADGPEVRFLEGWVERRDREEATANF